MFVTAVCVLFLLKLKWPKNKNFYDSVYERYGQETLKTVRGYEMDFSRYNKVSLNIGFSFPGPPRRFRRGEGPGDEVEISPFGEGLEASLIGRGNEYVVTVNTKIVQKSFIILDHYTTPAPARPLWLLRSRELRVQELVALSSVNGLTRWRVYARRLSQWLSQ